MNYAKADLQITSNCSAFIAQVFEGKLQVNRLKDSTFLKLGRFTVDEYVKSIQPLIQNAIKAIKDKPAPVKTITKKQDKSKDLKCPFKRSDNDLTIGKSYGLYNVCNLHCTIKDKCKIVCESLQTPIEPIAIEPIIPIAIEPVIEPVKPAKTDKLSPKSRLHMINILKASGVKLAKNVTDSALRIMYADLKG